MRVGIHRRVETFSISHSLLTRGLPLRGGGSEQGWHRPPGLRFQNGLAFVEHFGEFCGQPPSCLGHAVAEACGRLAGAALLLVDPAESSRGNVEFMEILALEGMRHEERLVAPLAGGNPACRRIRVKCAIIALALAGRSVPPDGSGRNQRRAGMARGAPPLPPCAWPRGEVRARRKHDLTGTGRTGYGSGSRRQGLPESIDL